MIVISVVIIVFKSFRTDDKSISKHLLELIVVITALTEIANEVPKLSYEGKETAITVKHLIQAAP